MYISFPVIEPQYYADIQATPLGSKVTDELTLTDIHKSHDNNSDTCNCDGFGSYNY